MLLKGFVTLTKTEMIIDKWLTIRNMEVETYDIKPHTNKRQKGQSSPTAKLQ